MKRIDVLLLLMTVCVSLSGCSAQIPVQNLPEEIPVAEDSFSEDFSEQDLRENHPGAIEILYSAETNQPKEIRGVFSSHTIFSEQDAVIALGSIRSFLGITDFSFCCVGTEYGDGFVVFDLAQLYHGIPVMDYGFRVAAKTDGTPLYVSGSYQSNIQIETVPVFNAETCAKGISLSAGERITSAELVIVIETGIPHLCWKYRIESKDPLYDYFLCWDALTNCMTKTIPLAIS